MLYIILAFVILIITIIIGIGVAAKQRDKKFKESQEKFQKKINEISNQMTSQLDEYLDKQRDDIQDALKEIKVLYENKKENVTQQISLLEDGLKKAKERQEQQLKELDEKTAEIVNSRAKIEAAQVQSVIEYYQNQQAQIVQEFESFKEDTEKQKEEILKELEKEQQKQIEIIEQYKRDEKIKQNKDFYRIKISENDQSDIKKLKSIAEELHDPSVLYKLIYKTYYERPFNEMIGRVVKGRGSIGIYKITNLEDGRIYIGQTRQTFKDRWKSHVKRGVRAEAGTANKLYTAMWEDGVENFTFEVLSECEANELNQKEKEFIEFYHANTWGYNSNKGVG